LQLPFNKNLDLKKKLKFSKRANGEKKINYLRVAGADRDGSSVCVIVIILKRARKTRILTGITLRQGEWQGH
jgi:hypothetical protein